jgi:hypothetical protein
MITLISSSVSTGHVDILKAALPIGIGLASAAYLTIKAANQHEVIASEVRWNRQLECHH